MAVVSDTMYNARTVAVPYVSSNAYYGYVPPCRRENQLEVVLERAEASDSPAFDRYSYDTAMETDDDGYDYSVASRCLNNDCVILEASARNRLEVQQQQCQQAIHHADTLQRRNRKRCNGDLGPNRELKKFREGGGNGRIYCGTGSTKDYGLATVRYESAPLHLNTINNKSLELSLIGNERCCWAAGNHSLISNPDCNDPKSIEKSTEYEKVLFETHGCSVYHHHRLQLLDTDCIETEF